MKNRSSSWLIISFLLLSLFTIGCGDDEGNQPSYSVPDTYQFENVDYSGQLTRLSMLNGLKDYMKTGVSADVVLDAEQLLAMYANTADANWGVAYDDSKQLKNKTFESAQSDFEALLTQLAATSAHGNAAVSGAAGVAVSLDGSKTYLLNEFGVEAIQVIEKGLMGACLYYQATSVYFGEGKMSGDNSAVVEGKGTEMEHAWDEAFGYLGVPQDFPSNTDGLFFWGDYLNDRNELLMLNQALMEAFRTGRAAISNDDIATRDQQITTIRNLWEKSIAATAIHYINSTIENFDDYAIRCHALSEAVAFTYSLKFNEGRSLSNSEIDDLLLEIGGSSNLTELDLLNITLVDLEAARSTMAEKFELTEQMLEL